MQPLKNERHEAFCQLVALGSSHTSAYISAGFGKRSARECAARLITKVNISTRIRWLQEQAADRGEVTMDSLIRDAQRCRDLGIWHGQINAAVLAVKELGILSGFRVERRETRTIDPATISDEELAAIIRAGAPIEVTPTHVTELKNEARARLEPPAQPNGNDGRSVGISKGLREENATISTPNANSAETPTVTAPPKPDPLDDLDTPPPPGTIEKRIRAIRGRPSGSRGRAKTDVKSTT